MARPAALRLAFALLSRIEARKGSLPPALHAQLVVEIAEELLRATGHPDVPLRGLTFRPLDQPEPDPEGDPTP